MGRQITEEQLEAELKPQVTWRQRVLSLLKYSVALAVLYFVLQQADLEQVLAYAKTIPVWIVLVAFIAFNMAQLFGALRMRYYYRAIGRELQRPFTFALYYVGLFYNLILPGGIGGDAYRVFTLKQRADFPVMEGVRLQLANRANGLAVLLFIMLSALFFIDFGNHTFLANIMTLFMILFAFLGYLVCAKLFLRENERTAIGALKYSFAIQGFTVLVIVALWYALGDGDHLAEYVFLFMLSMILGMVPITVGGLGIREFTFFYGSHYINQITGSELKPELGVTIALLFFAVTALTSASGILALPWLKRLSPCIADEK